MASPHARVGTRTAKRPARRGEIDATSLLEDEHRQVAAWFGDYERTDDEAEKARLSERICLALKVHTQVEEEVFYPAARAALKADQEAMVDEAVVEHAAAKALIAEIEQMEVDEDLYDARIKVLSEMIEHHVREEETSLFPACRGTDLDLAALGARLAARRDELTRKLARPNGRRAM
ncbi:MAG: hemerythrin domain-containing protein [Pseudomonadota bacterium]